MAAKAKRGKGAVKGPASVAKWMDAADRVVKKAAKQPKPMKRHAPEPWRVVENPQGAVFVYSGDIPVCRVDLLANAAHGTKPLEDARRIVACVNACRGIPTDVLDGYPVIGDLIGALVECRGELVNVYSLHGGDETMSHAIEMADNALKQAKVAL